MGEVDGQDLRQVFAANLRRLRQMRGLSQEGFAHLCGLHRTYIGGVERAEHNISVDNIGRIAVALGEPGWRMLQPADEAS